MIDATTVQTASESANLITLAYILVMAFVLSTLLALVYQKTFRGLSYSRNYVQAIILISIISAVVIQAVGDSLARGIGIIAAMAIIRFRTNFKDPRDTLFIFASLAGGIACGAYAFHVAIMGTLMFCLVAIVLYYSPVGPNQYFDGMLRFNILTDNKNQSELESILHFYCKAFSLITLREIEQGNRMDYAYHIKLRNDKHYEDLLRSLKQLDSMQGVNLMLQEATVDL
jgi:uncharacterized membrane protein YhiD involved in acid resistance